MKKMVDCPNWKEYQGLNGWLMFAAPVPLPAN